MLRLFGMLFKMNVKNKICENILESLNYVVILGIVFVRERGEWWGEC